MTSAGEANNELTLLRQLVSSLQQENALLRQKVEALIRRVFGSSSERIDPAQLELLLQLASGTKLAPELPRAEPVAVSKPPRQARAPRIPENLPVVEQVLDPEPVLTAPQEWRLIGHEVSEQLDFEPARFLRRRIIRRKYVHATDPDRAPIIAPLPEKLLESGVAGAGLLAHILVSKYADHLPLYRQEQIFAQRHQINLPRQTLARWVELRADWLQPIYEQIRTGVMAGGYVQVDETPVEYPDGHWKKELALHGRSRSWPARRHPLHERGKLPTPKDRSVRLPAHRSRTPAAHDQPADPRNHPRCLGQVPKRQQQLWSVTTSVIAALL